jgi:SET domain-containing protein
MLLTDKVFIAASRFHGVGLFAKEPIEAGTVISKYEPNFDQHYTLEEVKRWNELIFKYLERMTFHIPPRDDCSLDVYVFYGGNERFINHAKQNNVQFYWLKKGERYPGLIKGLSQLCIVTTQTIVELEELLLDYSAFDEVQYRKINDLIEQRDAKQWPPRKIPLTELR